MELFQFYYKGGKNLAVWIRSECDADYLFKISMFQIKLRILVFL